ncbi:DUF1835 domain-containing protein [Paraburkholderia sp. CNPSo 3274]|uniref:DUF1835 domain-containing protein n=1 Tax=Paraburkholderia sp. CNPSo 3274 TaxID=2940932 RepID=UPI0020B6E028|nr:DUF1835 domain-containing protein [Paraburkholderia sp. CNPSo 3274]MCP3710619.1 DUF1835 domain-containing protein [Paraburkholderia sp. CNPSo 3274]
MTTIHLIYGEPAVTTLRQALEAAGRPDRVIALCDDLTVGPLRDIDVAGNPGVAQRAAFWERLGDAPPALAHDDCAALNALEADDSHVVIWHTHDAAHQLALRRVCYRLRDVPQRLNEVRLTADEISGPNAAARIEARLPDAAPISVLRITRLALEWQEAKFANGETRRWRDNTFTSGTWSDLDAMILDVLDAHEDRPAGASWLASDALGAALTRGGAGFTVGEPVVLWRLRELCAAEELRLRDDMCAACAPLAAAARAARPPLPQTAAHLSLPR